MSAVVDAAGVAEDDLFGQRTAPLRAFRRAAVCARTSRNADSLCRWPACHVQGSEWTGAAVVAVHILFPGDLLRVGVRGGIVRARGGLLAGISRVALILESVGFLESSEVARCLLVAISVPSFQHEANGFEQRVGQGLCVARGRIVASSAPLRIKTNATKGCAHMLTRATPRRSLTTFASEGKSW